MKKLALLAGLSILTVSAFAQAASDSSTVTVSLDIASWIKVTPANESRTFSFSNGSTTSDNVNFQGTVQANCGWNATFTFNLVAPLDHIHVNDFTMNSGAPVTVNTNYGPSGSFTYAGPGAGSSHYVFSAYGVLTGPYVASGNGQNGGTIDVTVTEN